MLMNRTVKTRYHLRNADKGPEAHLRWSASTHDEFNCFVSSMRYTHSVAKRGGLQSQACVPFVYFQVA